MPAYPERYYDAYFVGLPGDVEFYRERTAGLRGPVLEVGAGTGRVMAPLAAAGVRVIGLEPDPALAARAQARLDALGPLPPGSRLVQGRVEELELAERLSAVVIPYRTFQHLLSPADQVEALTRLHARLRAGGLLLMDTYDPLQELLREGLSAPLRLDTDFVDAATGHRVCVWYGRRVDLALQLLEQDLVFEAVDPHGTACGRVVTELVLRYAPRLELEYLLELCGFAVEELYGDFHGGPYPGYGNQIWVARRT